MSSIAGAEVLDVDLRSELPAGLRRELREAWGRYGLLVFRGQELSPEDQRRAAEIFGRVSSECWKRRSPRDDGIDFVSNVLPGANNPYGALAFHSDNSFFEHPLSGLMLYALEVPPEGAGGDTLFCNMKLVYRRLPQPLRERIAGYRVRHGYPDTRTGLEIPGLDKSPDAPSWVHPLVPKHRATGEPYLFMSRRHVDCIEDLPRPESDALIDELYGYVGKPEETTSHAWRPGDLVVFDNLMLQHGRTDFDRKHRRHLRRLQIA